MAGITSAAFIRWIGPHGTTSTVMADGNRLIVHYHNSQYKWLYLIKRVTIVLTEENVNLLPLIKQE